jgi:cell division protein FtsL
MWSRSFIQGLLLVLVLFAALSVVTSQHQARKAFIALQQEKQHAQQMEIEWGQLQLEQSTLAAPARIERIATRQLHMQLPQKSQVKFIRVAQTPGYVDGHQVNSDNGAVQ